VTDRALANDCHQNKYEKILLEMNEEALDGLLALVVSLGC
jgi:hypothetical protein